VRPSLSTDAYEDDVARDVPLVFLAGPIKHWWDCWGSTSHNQYVQHRERTRAALIDAGYLTYAPWDAIKGTWSHRAQAINDAGIRGADLLLDLTPANVPALGTAAEVAYAEEVGTPVLRVPPVVPARMIVRHVERLLGPGHRYEELAA
jgi:hypothetical protein